MNTLFAFVMANAVIATALLGAILLLKPLIRNHPVVLHWLFLLVLIKLVTPPIWSPQWTLLPAEKSGHSLAAAPELEASGNDFAPEPNFNAPPSPIIAAGPMEARAESPIIGAKAVTTAETNVDSSREAAATRETPKAAQAPWLPAIRFRSLGFLAALWGVGACFFWGLSMWRVYRFERCLRFAEAAPIEVQAIARGLADQLGLARSRAVLIAPGDVSPMLWAFCRRARIIVPAELFGKLTDSARRSLLLHELVH